MINIKNIYLNKYVSINDERYFFIDHEKKRFIIPDKCPHKGGPLSLGFVCKKEGMVQCPWHDNRFKLSFLLKKSIPAIRVKDNLFYV